MPGMHLAASGPDISAAAPAARACSSEGSAAGVTLTWNENNKRYCIDSGYEAVIHFKGVHAAS